MIDPEATTWYQCGATPLPVAPDGTKRPAVHTWRHWQTNRPTPTQLEHVFDVDHDGFGILTGHASGDLEMLELEGVAVREGLVAQLAELFTAVERADLWHTITTGSTQISPSGGLHYHYRTSDGPALGNTKLARRPATDTELVDQPGNKIRVLVETRGEGGFTVCAPSAGRTHPTGQAWTQLAGGPDTVPSITVADRDLIHTLCRLLDQIEDQPTPDPGTTSHPVDPDHLRPGDDYNQRATWDDILLPHGWTKLWHRGTTTYWRRPGKGPREGNPVSASTGRNEHDRLFVFSTSTDFQAEVPYSKFGAYALLEHGGDHAAAAKALRAEGYGDQEPALTPEATLTLVRTSQPDLPAPTPITSGSTALAHQPAPLVDLAKIGLQYGPTEDGTARALAQLHATDLRYCAQRGSWLIWQGARWEWDVANQHREHIKAIARTLPEQDTAWKNYKRRALSAVGTTGVARQAESIPALAVHIDQLDAQPWELNTPAGVVDMRTGTLAHPTPQALHTRTTSVAPDFDRRPEAFLKFLGDTFGGDTELTTYVQRLLGLSLVGKVIEQVLPFAFGSGANGKSTLLEAVMDAAGRGDRGYAIAANPEMLMVRRHSEHPAELAQLAGARLVVCSELEEGSKFAESRVKQLTGSDSVNARFMRGNPFTFTPSHTIWLIGNSKPATTSGGRAFWRRLQLIPFENQLPDNRMDKSLPDRLKEESGAILAWLIQGAAQYHAGGLGIPEQVAKATAEYQHDQDSVGKFLDEHCHRANGSLVQTKVATIRDAYEQFCFQTGDTPLGTKTFTQELEKRGIPSRKGGKGVRYYTGIALLSDQLEDEE